MQNNEILNMIKNETEIKAIKKAAQIVDEVYDWLLENIKESQTELEVSKTIYNQMIERGAEGTSFDTIVAFGKNGAEPHHEPDVTKLQKGDFVTVDMGCIVDGYCSDFTRTFAYGNPNEKQIEIYNAVKLSQELGLEATVVGANCFDVDKVCRDSLTKSGFGEYFIHGTGHGVGKEIHEVPYLNKKGTVDLQKNMVVTVEPGVYIENFGGVRIEDMVVVGENKRVSKHGTDLIVINAEKQ